MFTNREINELPLEKQQKLKERIEESGSEYGVYPLSAEQERMWFLYQLDIKNPYYNGMTKLEFDGTVKEEQVKRALEMVVERQTILRTIYITIQGKSYQVINDEFELPYDQYDFSGEQDIEKKVHDIIRNENTTPFDLTEELPIKGVFVRVSPVKCTLYLKMHHICSDGWSYGILVREFKEAYELLQQDAEAELPELSFNYADYGIWQAQQMESGIYKKQVRYWRERLRDCQEEVHFCFEKEDRDKRNKGAALEIEIGKEETEGLINLARKHHTSVYTVALALYLWNLFHYSGQTTINIGTPVANRQSDAYKDVAGYFANTLVIRADRQKNMSFQQLVEQLKEHVIDAIANQDIPFDKLVQELNINRKADMTPLFQVMFSLRNKTLVNGDMMEDQKLSGSTMSFHTIGTEYVDYIQFKMIFTLTQYDDRIQVSLGYNKDVFEREYMEWFLSDYIQLLHWSIKQDNIALDTLPERIGQKSKVSYLPSEQIIKAEMLKEPEQEIEWEGGQLYMRTSSGIEAVPGIEGDILIKPEGEKSWYITGDKGYVDRQGDLQVTRRKYQIYQIGQEWHTVENYQRRITEHAKLNQCVITVHNQTEKLQFMIYYTSDSAVENEAFYEVMTEEERKSIEVKSIMLSYLPLMADGFYDTSRMDKEIYEVIKDEAPEQMEELTAKIYEAGIEKESTQSVNIKELFEVTPMEETKQETESNRLSQLSGGKLEELPFKTLGALLKTQAEKYGDKKIRFIQYNEPETSITYKQLYQEARKVAQGLYNMGIRKGDKVIMMSRRLDWYLKSLWGLMYMGAIPVPLGPVKLVEHTADAAVDKFLKVYDKLAHPVVLTSAKETEDVKEVAQEFKLEMSRLWTMEELPAQEEFEPDYEIHEKDTTMILFTSGSTGMPKGVELCHRNILKRSQATTRFNEQTDNDISLNWMPLDHVGGVVMFHIRDVFGGVEQIQVETAEIVKAPLLWMEYVNKYRVNLTWAPNFAYGLVVQKRDEIKNCDWDLSCLRFILNGGELIQEKASLDFLKILRSKGLSPDAMYPSWGMSETSSGVLFSKYFGKRNWNGYVEVGEPIPGDEFRIVDEQNHVVPQGVVGSLQIRGETVTKGYYDAQDTNRESFSEDGWFITGDLAIMNQNQITLTGRNNDLVIMNGVNYTCTELEQAALEGAPYLDVAVVLGVTEKTNAGEKLAVFYVNNSDVEEKKAQKDIRKGIFAKFSLQVDYMVSLKEEEVPRGALEKVQRKKIKQRFQDGWYDERIETKAENFGNWFYKESWNPKAFDMFQKEEKQTYLILCDRTGMAQEAGRQLELRNNQCFYVYQGDHNAVEENQFTVNPLAEGTYQWIWKQLQEKDIEPEVIVHAWCYTDEEWIFEKALEYGIYSIKNLFAYTEERKKPCRIIVASNGAYDFIMPEKRQAEKAALSGFLRSALLEARNTEISYIDFGQADAKEDGSRLVYESLQEKAGAFITYQNQQRLSMNLTSCNMNKYDNLVPAIQPEGLYILTGGLGGIGVQLAQYLLKQYHAELILIGRSTLDDEEKKREFEKLKILGKVHYMEIDICNADALEEAVMKQEQKIGKTLEGIFHMAGTMELGSHYENMEQHLIVNETREEYEKMFQAKVKGTDAIYQLLMNHSDCMVVNFSSCNGIFGGNSFSAYSAANSYQDAMTDKMQAVTSGTCKTINWSMWEHTGMSESIDEKMSSISEAMGYQLITPEYGISSLECVLQRDLSHVIVGISGSNKNMNQKYRSGFYMQPINYQKQTTEELTEWEEAVKAVWESVLGHDNFGKTDKFFEIGGNSIMSIQLVAAMNKLENVNIGVVDLFKYTTVEQLANYIQECQKTTQEEAAQDDEMVGMTF